jgi:hypothetical protein
MAIRHQVLNPPTTWVAVGNEEPLITGRFIVRDRDTKFIKLFPIFTAAILKAMRDKKLKGSRDLLVFFFDKLMDARINGTEDQIAITAPADLIARETGKSIRAVRENIAILLELGFLKQPRRGVPDYVVPPPYAYRGVLEKLLKDRFRKGAVPAAQASKEIKAKRLPPTISPPPKEK